MPPPANYWHAVLQTAQLLISSGGGGRCVYGVKGGRHDTMKACLGEEWDLSLRSSCGKGAGGIGLSEKGYLDTTPQLVLG